MENTTTKQVETADKAQLLAAFAARQDAIALGWDQYRRLVSAYTYRMLVVETFTHPWTGRQRHDITPHLLCSASRKPWFVVVNPYFDGNTESGDAAQAYLPCRFQDLDLTIMRVVAGPCYSKAQAESLAYDAFDDGPDDTPFLDGTIAYALENTTGMPIGPDYFSDGTICVLDGIPMLRSVATDAAQQREYERLNGGR